MYLEKYASQIRSVAFSVINQLPESEYYGKLPVAPPESGLRSEEEDYCKRIYSLIIDNCRKLEKIKITESGKKEKTVVPNNRDCESEDTVLYYAYIYFSSLTTMDYIQELQGLLEKQANDISRVMDFRTERITGLIDKNLLDLSVRYVDLENFLDQVAAI